MNDISPIRANVKPADPSGRPAPNPARRERVLEAAERLFSASGFRAVTMAGIADAAGFAKGTVYAYFADKDDVFRNVRERVVTRLLAGIETALRAPGTTTERVTAALRAKDLAIYDLVSSSPHAAEIFAARDRVARDEVEQTDRRLLELISGALDDGIDRGLPPAHLARLVVRASRGLAARASDRDTLAADIAILVPRVIDQRT